MSFFIKFLFTAVLVLVTSFAYADLIKPGVEFPREDSIAYIPQPVEGNGKLSVVIESYTGKNPRRFSQLAERVEVWLGDKRLAALNKDDSGVTSEKKRRIFVFSDISLPHGYYIITIRLYGPGAFYGREKWHGENIQTGIHPGRTSRVYKKISFFNW